VKKILLLLLIAIVFGDNLKAQGLKVKSVPEVVKAALATKYPDAANVTWEKEKGNYEANWGGKSGEDTSVQFTPGGAFVEEVDAIVVNQLPASITHYVKLHYKGAKIKEAGKVTDATGRKMFEAEVKGKDLLFDESGKFIKVD